MGDRESMLRAVLNNPPEDTARLVYADCLDENGQHQRAEFVRVQCALSANPPHKRTSYPDEPMPLRALGDKHYRFLGYTDDGFDVGDRVDLLRHREPKAAKWVYGLRVYKIVPRTELHSVREVDVYARLDDKSGPWDGQPLRDRERAMLARLCHFSKVLKGWAAHNGQFANTLGVGAPTGYEMSVALFDAPERGRACLNFSYSRNNTKATGDMRLYFDRGFACEWWCALLDFREHAGFMFGAHPITTVRFTEHEPTRYLNETHPDIWRTLPCEWSDFTYHGQLPGWLPRELCAIGDFDSKESATAAVSEKAVAYGRRIAGLTALTAAA